MKRDGFYTGLVIDSRGIALIAWIDHRNGNRDIYGTWSATLPGDEGRFSVVSDGTLYFSYWGNYPDGYGIDPPRTSSNGVSSTVSVNSKGVIYEVDIDLLASPLNATSGSSFRFGFRLHDSTNFYPHHYGCAGEWPKGLLWDCAATLGDLQLAYVADVPANNHQPPVSFHLEQNYTNPFNQLTCICYMLPKTMHVRLNIYNIRG